MEKYVGKNQSQAFDILYDFLKNKCGVKDRDTYYNDYQDTITYIMEYTFNLDNNTLKGITEALGKYLKKAIMGGYVNPKEAESGEEIDPEKNLAIDREILKYLDQNNVPYELELVNNLENMNSLINTIVEKEDQLYSDLMIIILNYENLFYPHYPHVVYAYILNYTA